MPSTTHVEPDTRRTRFLVACRDGKSCPLYLAKAQTAGKPAETAFLQNALWFYSSEQFDVWLDGLSLVDPTAHEVAVFRAYRLAGVTFEVDLGVPAEATTRGA